MTDAKQPMLISTDEHGIQSEHIHPNALKVMRRLQDAGFEAYLVGGSLRDLLVHLSPKDFDVATNAHPEQVKRLFKNCILIGRRFRLAHIRFGAHVVEVATFRAKAPLFKRHLFSKTKLGLVTRDNVYGTLEEDVLRRDFTINALYYRHTDGALVDYVQGFHDLKHRVIRLIGSAEERYREDPVRMLRAIRFKSKLDFSLHEETEQPILTLGHLLQHIPPARLYDEIQKLFFTGNAQKTFHALIHYDLFKYLFPQTAAALDHPKNPQFKPFLLSFLGNVDERLRTQQSLNPAFFYAAMLWPALVLAFEKHCEEDISPMPAFEMAMSRVISTQNKQVSIPHRLTLVSREIWRVQQQLIKRTKHQQHLFGHPRFKAAYDFLLLRSQAGETDLNDLINWWTHFMKSTVEQQQTMMNELPQAPPRSRRRRRRRRH